MASHEPIAAAKTKRFHVENPLSPNADVTLEKRNEKRNTNTTHDNIEKRLIDLTFLMKTGKLREYLYQKYSTNVPVMEHLQGMK